jgi:hypothetical protein
MTSSSSKSFGRVASARARGGFLPQEAADHDVLQHGKPRERLDDLEAAADAGGADLVGTQALNLLSLEDYFSNVRGKYAGDHAEEGGLAGAVRADQGVDAALGNLERRVVHGAQAAERFADLSDLEQVHCRDISMARLNGP